MPAGCAVHSPDLECERLLEASDTRARKSRKYPRPTVSIHDVLVVAPEHAFWGEAFRELKDRPSDHEIRWRTVLHSLNMNRRV